MDGIGMKEEDFKRGVREMADFIVNYNDTIRDRPVVPKISPGYLRPLVPEHAPEEPETWDDVMKDIERVIMPGVTHWQAPQFHAFFPTGQSYPSILADMLSDMIGGLGFSWHSSPAFTELEVVMLDWLGELLGLPSDFLFKTGTGGGGVIQGSASEATLMALLCSKSKLFREKSLTEIEDKAKMTVKLVAYTSEDSHSSVEKAALLGGVKMRLLETDGNCSLRGQTLQNAIEEDISQGLIPFFVCATLGTTSTCAFDNLSEIGEVTQQHGIWLHVDAAYAGSAFICEEFRALYAGIEKAQSFNFNPHKWLLVNFDCSTMWVKNCEDISSAFKIDPLYLRHGNQGSIMPDYRNWQISLGRRFRALKLWFGMRLHGASGLRTYIRAHVSFAKQFAELVRADHTFEIVHPVEMGLVCFRMKGSREANEKLRSYLDESGVIYLIPSLSKAGYFLRFVVCSRFIKSEDILLAWNEIQKQADSVQKLGM